MNTKKVTQVLSITSALMSAAYGTYRFLSYLSARKGAIEANKKYDNTLADSMDCSDAVASY